MSECLPVDPAPWAAARTTAYSRPGERNPVDALIGETPQMRDLRAVVVKVAHAAIPVLIEGPSGAGKELVAAALHGASGRNGSLVSLNVSAIADTMFEDALFGHVRGAFTGAASDVPGYLMEAHQGTLFLDEIGTLDLAVQAKLLRVLDTRAFRPVGARSDRCSDFRIISATNASLSALHEDGRFRLDLVQRLSGVTIVVPPLRDRLDDLPLLSAHLLARIGARRRELTDGAVEVLRTHAWPGNVRELRFVLERAVLLAGNGELTRTAIQRALSRAEQASGTDFARHRLADVLIAHDWNVKLAAPALGVHWTTLYRRMKQLGVGAPKARWLPIDIDRQDAPTQRRNVGHDD